MLQDFSKNFVRWFLVGVLLGLLVYGCGSQTCFSQQTNLGPNATQIRGILQPVNGGTGLNTSAGNGCLSFASGVPSLVSCGGSGSGSVTSVGLALPGSIFTVTGSPVTGTGTLTGAFNAQAQNSVWAGPSSGGAGVPTFRALVTGDLPAGTFINCMTTLGDMITGGASGACTRLPGITTLSPFGILSSIGDGSGHATAPTWTSTTSFITSINGIPCPLTGGCTLTALPASTCATVTSSATPGFNFATPCNTLTLTTNVTSSAATGFTAGNNYSLFLVQDATGGRTFVPPTVFKGWAGIINLSPNGKTVCNFTAYTDGNLYLQNCII